MGINLLNRGNIQSAILSTEQALGLARDINHEVGEGNALGNLALIYLRSGDKQKALEYIKEADKVFGTSNPHTHPVVLAWRRTSGSYILTKLVVGIAFVFRRLGYSSSPTKLFRRLFGESEKRNIATGWHRMALELEEIDKNEAIAAYRCALVLAPNEPSIHNNLADLLLELGKLDEAVTHFQSRIRLRPKDALYAHVHLV